MKREKCAKKASTKNKVIGDLNLHRDKKIVGEKRGDMGR